MLNHFKFMEFALRPKEDFQENFKEFTVIFKAYRSSVGTLPKFLLTEARSAVAGVEILNFWRFF